MDIRDFVKDSLSKFYQRIKTIFASKDEVAEEAAAFVCTLGAQSPSIAEFRAAVAAKKLCICKVPDGRINQYFPSYPQTQGMLVGYLSKSDNLEFAVYDDYNRSFFTVYPTDDGNGGVIWNAGELVVVPYRLSQLTSDSTHSTVTYAEKSTWNGKADILYVTLDDDSAHFADIYSALQQGKLVIGKYEDDDTPYYVVKCTSEEIVFWATPVDGQAFSISIDNTDVWAYSDNTYLVTDTEKTTWNDKYTKPSGGIPASDLASGVIPSVPVTDVTVGGTSVVSSGTAAIVEASSSDYGVVKVDKNAGGISKDNNGKLILDTASNAEIEAKTTACALKVRQIDHAVKVGITTNTETLSSSEQAAAKSWLGVNDTPEIFWATYGTTTAAEIDAAVAEGKAVMVAVNNRVFRLESAINGQYYFVASAGDYIYNIVLTNSWGSLQTKGLELTSRKVTSWQSTPSDSKYPSEKLVYDSLGKMGVISQTQTWTQAADGGYDYVMSDPVMGLIPQSFIDLATSAGAVFNDVSGYFELNGLTDISYNEMTIIYEQGKIGFPLHRYQFYNTKARTTLPLNPMAFNYSSAVGGDGLFMNSTKIEVVRFTDESQYNQSFNIPNFTDIGSAFNNARYVKDISFMNAPSGGSAFVSCYNLERAMIAGINNYFSFSQSPRLTPASVAYMINNAGTATITITLHATAYARAIADTDVQAALAAHTNVTLASA